MQGKVKARLGILGSVLFVATATAGPQNLVRPIEDASVSGAVALPPARGTFGDRLAPSSVAEREFTLPGLPVGAHLLVPAGSGTQLLGTLAGYGQGLFFAATKDGRLLQLATPTGTVELQRTGDGFLIRCARADGYTVTARAIRQTSGYRVIGASNLDPVLVEVLGSAKVLISEVQSAAPAHERDQSQASLAAVGQDITFCEVTAVLTTTAEAAAVAAAFPTMGGSLLAGAVTSVFFGLLWAAVC